MQSVVERRNTRVQQGCRGLQRSPERIVADNDLRGVPGVMTTSVKGGVILTVGGGFMENCRPSVVRGLRRGRSGGGSAAASTTETTMMADPSAAERAYQHLKSDILKGVLPAGALDARTIGDRLRMSVTPVREALARLHSERLVSLSPHQGYAVSAPSALRLEGLYDLTGLLIDACLERIKAAGTPKVGQARTLPLYGDYADDMTTLVREIAISQGNPELSDQIASLNDRLLLARRCEPKLFPNAVQEAGCLATLFGTRDISGLQLLLRTHHRLRVERVDALARLVAEAVGQR